MRAFHADLHIHTCLSPCGDFAMTPSAIATAARRAGLDLVAVCDHNASANVRSVRTACGRNGIGVIGGIEINTREEIHILALFPDDKSLDSMQSLLDGHLPDGNDPEAFGEQIIMDDRDRAVGIEQRLLIGSADIGLDRILEEIHSRRGLAVACHADRETNGILRQIGFIPEGIALDGLELSRLCKETDEDSWRKTGIPLLRSSDAHYPGEIGRCRTVFEADKPDLEALKTALKTPGKIRILCKTDYED